MEIDAPFYAVKVGKAPGIYRSWQECQPLVLGHPGAVYKRFDTLDEAEEFLAGPMPKWAKQQEQNMPYDEKNRGAIWKNDRKETDNHPDFTGKINVEGVEYWVSAWKRRPDEDPGRPALNFSIRPKNPPQEKPAQAPAARPAAPQDFDDQIPF